LSEVPLGFCERVKADTEESPRVARLRSRRWDGVNGTRGGDTAKRLTVSGLTAEDPQGPRETERANGEEGSHDLPRWSRGCL